MWLLKVRKKFNMPKVSRVMLLTLPNGFFGSAITGWKTLDTQKILGRLESRGYEVKKMAITNYESTMSDSETLIVYTSSEDYTIRSFVKDKLYFDADSKMLAPRYDLLMAHENKGFQEILRRRLNIGNLKGGYCFDFDDLPKIFPYVYKSTSGAGSSGVHLVSSKSDLRRIKKRYFSVSLFRRAVKLYRKLTFDKSLYEEYAYRHKGFSRGVYQEFIAGLDGDYKVLVFGEKYYCLKRGIRDNDFRASGSGNFRFESTPDDVLDFAKKIFESLETPYASLDIAKTKNSCHLIEFQCLNFGPYTLLQSPGFYKKTTESLCWEYISGQSDLENEFAESIDYYIRTKLS